MTQAYLGQIADTSEESGDELALRLNNFDQAHKTGQLGTSRPAGIAKGGHWSRSNADGTVDLMVYNGVGDDVLVRNATATGLSLVQAANAAAARAVLELGTAATRSFLDQDDMASNSDQAVPSQQSVKAYVDSNALGVGQTWQNVTNLRAHSTIYHNTEGRPIEVGISFNSGGPSPVQVSQSGSDTWITVGHTSGQSNTSSQFTVPPGWYYRIGGAANFAVWSELR